MKFLNNSYKHIRLKLEDKDNKVELIIDHNIPTSLLWCLICESNIFMLMLALGL